MNLRERFRALFSPRRRWLGTDTPVVQDGGWLGPLEVIVPRAQCTYRRLAFPQVPIERRAEALALAASRAAPEPGGGWTARWQDDVAHLWCFPAAVQDAMEPTAVAVAESALVPPPAADADHLIELAEGVEGQVWRSGRLLATRWWPAVPGDDAWLQFLRSASVEPMAGRPALQSVTLADAPWGRSVQRFAWSAAQLERAFWRALVVVLGLLVGWQAAATAAWSIADAWQSSRLEGLRAESAPLIDARERAEAAQARMEALVGLVAPSSDYVLVAEVKQRLPDDARLVGWLRDPVSLRVALRTGERDPRVFVQAFSDHPDLRAVQANPTERGADIELLFDLESSRAEEEG